MIIKVKKNNIIIKLHFISLIVYPGLFGFIKGTNNIL
jgi:hypothetical protein